MSTTAPWLALAIDWMDSDMFDESTHGARLAWICLLCHAKSNGRAGRVKLNKKTFARRYDLTARSVMEMLSLAQKCADDPAIMVNGDLVTICNWKNYQDPKRKTADSYVGEINKTPKKHATPDPVPITPDPSPRTKKKNSRSNQRGKYPPEFEALWEGYGKKGGKADSHVEWGRLRPVLSEREGQGWHKWLTERAALYRSLVPDDQFCFTKDLERWLKGGLYDFDADSVRKTYSGEGRTSGAGSSGPGEKADRGTEQRTSRRRRDFAEPCTPIPDLLAESG